MTKREVIMRVRNLSKGFQLKSYRFWDEAKVLHALTDVSFDLFEGETLGVIGESGCGKSTLGKTIVGLHTASSGKVFYRNKDLFQLKGQEAKQIKQEIQMVFQDPYSSLNPRFTARQLIEEPLLVHHLCPSKNERNKRVLELLHEVGLDVQHANRYPHEFSGGQRQRICVARALALEPKVIICDEPVSALDVSIQAQVLNLLNKLQRDQRLTYLFISHDLSVIKHISDRMIIMYLGRIVEMCNADKIYENPLHPYSKALLSAIPPESPFEKKKRIILKGEIPSPIGTLVGCSLASRCPLCSEQCLCETPQLLESEKGHFVACHNYNK